MILMNLDLAFEHESFGILWRFFQDFLILTVRFVDAVVQNQKLNVGLPRGKVIGMCSCKQREFRQRSVVLPAADIGVAEKAVSGGVAGQLLFGGGQDFLCL